MFLRLLLESFRRQRRRKLLAGLAILLGTTAVTAMLALATTVGDRIHAELAVYGANIVVTPKAAGLGVNIGGVDIAPATGNALLHESDLAKLQTIFWHNNITAVSPELAFTRDVSVPDLVQPGGKATTIMGLWFNHNLTVKGASSLITGVQQLHPSWSIRGRFPSSPREVAVGANLVKKLGLFDRILVFTLKPNSNGLMQGKGQVFRIVGIVTAGDSVDDRVLMPLESAQWLTNLPDAVSRVEIAARTRPEDAFARQDPDTLSPKQRDLWYCRPYANSIAYQIREAIPDASAQQVRRVEQSEGNVLRRISGLMALIAAAALLAAGFAVSAAMATAVLERRSEIGLMRSLGASHAAIALLFYVEAAILALFAGLLGYLAGSAIAATLGDRIFAPPAAHIGLLQPLLHPGAFNPVLLPITTGLALLVALAGSTPAIRSALRVDPSTILRAGA